jgi:hypothetical protein
MTDLSDEDARLLAVGFRSRPEDRGTKLVGVSGSSVDKTPLPFVALGSASSGILSSSHGLALVMRGGASFTSGGVDTRRVLAGFGIFSELA